ncbi:MAG: hypothetical protein HKN47_11635 [Pirellulaceae bacterium]|nr:hypothetical protein [Pirellulaceae bacterium]
MANLVGAVLVGQRWVLAGDVSSRVGAIRSLVDSARYRFGAIDTVCYLYCGM